MRWWKKRRGKQNDYSNGESCLERETKTTPIPTFKDNGGKFICYCTYEGHPGTSLTPSICEDRRCEHYHKLYVIEGHGYFPPREKPQPARMPSNSRPYNSGNGRH